MSRENSPLFDASRRLLLNTIVSNEREKAIKNSLLPAEYNVDLDTNSTLSTTDDSNNISNRISIVLNDKINNIQVTDKHDRCGREILDRSSDLAHSISREIDSNLALIDIETFNFKQLPEPLSRLISLIDKNGMCRGACRSAEEGSTDHAHINKHSTECKNFLDKESNLISVAQEGCLDRRSEVDNLLNRSYKISEIKEQTEENPQIPGTTRGDAITDERKIELSEAKYTIAFHDSISSGASSDLSQTLNDSASISQCELVDSIIPTKHDQAAIGSQHTDSAINSSITQEEKYDTSKNPYSLLKNNDSFEVCVKFKSNTDEEVNTSSQRAKNQPDHQSHLLCQEVDASGSPSHVIDRGHGKKSDHLNTPTKDVYILYPNYSLPDLNFLKTIHEYKDKRLITEKKNICDRSENNGRANSSTLNITSYSKTGKKTILPDKETPSRKLKVILDRYDSSDHFRFLLPVHIKMLLDKIKSQLNLRKKERFSDYISQNHLNKLNEASELIDVKKRNKLAASVDSKDQKRQFTNKYGGSKVHQSLGSSRKSKYNNDECNEKMKFKSKTDDYGLGYLKANNFLPNNMYNILLVSSSNIDGQRPHSTHLMSFKVTDMIDDDRIDDGGSMSDSAIYELSRKLSLPRTVYHVLKILWSYEHQKIIPSSLRLKNNTEIKIKPHQFISSDVQSHSRTIHPAINPSSCEVNMIKQTNTYVIHPTLIRRRKQGTDVFDPQRDITRHMMPTDQHKVGNVTIDPLSKTQVTTLPNRILPLKTNHTSGTIKKSLIPILMHR